MVKAKKVKKPAVATNKNAGYEQDFFAEFRQKEILNVNDITDAMRNVRSMVERGDPQEDIVGQINRMLGVTGAIFEKYVLNARKPVGHIFDDFSADGWKLFIRYRPNASQKITRRSRIKIIQATSITTAVVGIRLRT